MKVIYHPHFHNTSPKTSFLNPQSNPLTYKLHFHQDMQKEHSWPK
uniref:Uncharacterized protein n=1 Tax=Rhizophora mucronata TaxID=61149 RepID=A0A2P2P6C7_RHIMU